MVCLYLQWTIAVLPNLASAMSFATRLEDHWKRPEWLKRVPPAAKVLSLPRDLAEGEYMDVLCAFGQTLEVPGSELDGMWKRFYVMSVAFNHLRQRIRFAR